MWFSAHQNFEESSRESEVEIFKNWFLTETTQNRSFRNPRRIHNELPKRPKDFLKPDENERKILKVV